MKVQILNKTDTEIQFQLEGVSPAFASALRRIMISEVPTMAIEWVDFKKNDSALNDEIVANRMGQIPLTFNPKDYNLLEKCKCEGKGCSNCQVELILKKKGPCIVYSEDLKSKDKTVRPVFEKISIVELFEDEELEFLATAQLGTGRKHAKWQAAIVGYKNKPVGNIERVEESDETEYLEDTFIFNVESVCGLNVEDVILQAADILEEKISDFSKALGKLK